MGNGILTFSGSYSTNNHTHTTLWVVDTALFFMKELIRQVFFTFKALGIVFVVLPLFAACSAIAVMVLGQFVLPLLLIAAVLYQVYLIPRRLRFKRRFGVWPTTRSEFGTPDYQKEWTHLLLTGEFL